MGYKSVHEGHAYPVNKVVPLFHEHINTGKLLSGGGGGDLCKNKLTHFVYKTFADARYRPE